MTITGPRAAIRAFALVELLKRAIARDDLADAQHHLGRLEIEVRSMVILTPDDPSQEGATP